MQSMSIITTTGAMTAGPLHAPRVRARSNGKTALGDFSAAVRGRLRGGSGATARGGSADSHRDGWTLDSLRRQARSLQRNNKLSMAMVQRTVDMVVADGPRIQVKSADAEFNALAEKFLRTWAATGVDHRSWTGIDGRPMGNSLADICGLAISEAFEAGDLWVLPTSEGKAQLIEAERVVTPGGPMVMSDRPTIINGVEFDQSDRPVRVHVGSWIDKSSGGRTVKVWETTPVEIGRILHLPAPLHRKPNLTRPEPALTAVIEDFELIAHYIRDVARAADNAAYFGLVFKTGVSQELGVQLPGSDVTKKADDGVYYSQRQVELEPGFILNLDRDDEVEQINPLQPTTNFDSFVLTNLAMIGAGSGLPLSLWLLDMRQVNFSSARVAVLLAGSVIGVWRRWLAQRLLLPLLTWRLKMALWEGQIPGYGPAAGKVPDGFDDVRVGFAPLPVVDTMSQYQAEAYAIQQKLKTFEDVQVNFFGNDYSEHIDKLAAETEDFTARGILPTTMPGQVDPNAGTGGGRSPDGEPTP